jgi:dynein heavy chain
VIRKLKKYIDDPQYQPETVAKQSKAAMSLCMWTRAMDVYHRVAKVRDSSGRDAEQPCLPAMSAQYLSAQGVS